ncbi:MAG: RHS repeat protein [Planctomycetes bacterium]|nr:RHS repeat protein [Planctomycetota bacterium]MCB9936212.1 RHS repeat protein [Planctomycetota bacterium]
MSVYAFTACLFLLLVPVLGAAELHVGQREVDPAVPHRNAAEVGPGVRLANGSFAHEQLDLATAGRVMGLSMRRVYRSDMQFDGPLGKGWTCEYLQAAWRDADTGDLHWHDAQGFLHLFVLHDGDYQAPPGVYVKASWDESTERVHLRRADGTRLDFNSDGQLAAIADRNGNCVSLQYDTGHRLASVTDDRGFLWEFAYDGNGRITQLIDRVWQTGTRNARSVAYEYDAEGRLTCVKLPETARYNDAHGNRVRREYDYDAAGRLVRVIDPNQAPTHGPARIEVVYDSGGRVIGFRDGDANCWHRLRYTLDAIERPLVRHIDPCGVRADHTLDGFGHAVRVQQFTGFWEVSLDEPLDHDYVAQTGAALRAADPAGFVTDSGYSSGHELVLRTYPGGSREEFSYPVAAKLALGEVTEVIGSLLTRADAGWEAGAFTGGYVRLGATQAQARYYEVADNTEDTITVVGADLVQHGWGEGTPFVVFTENPDPLAAGNLLRLRRISSDVGQADIVCSWCYEPFFQQVRGATSARGHTTTWQFAFDTTGDPDAPGAGCMTLKRSPQVTVRLPDGSIQTVVYETHYTHDQFGRLIETVDPEGGIESRSYYSSGDQEGFLYEIARDTGSADLVERLEYDKSGILTGQYPPAALEQGADPEAFKLSWQVNALGQRWHELGPVVAGTGRAETCRYFDPSGNEVRTWRKYVASDGAVPPEPTNYDDPNSFGKEAADMAATWVETTRAFDLAGRVLGETSDAAAAAPVETVTWETEYDALGRRVAQVSPLLNRTAWQYDERGLLWRRIEGAGSAVEGIYEHDYDLDGRLAAERTPLGHATLHAHDGHGREVSVIDPGGHSRSLEWDEGGNLAAESVVAAGGAVLSRFSWSYDELDRRCLQQRLARNTSGDAIGDGFETTRLTMDGRGAIVALNDGPGRTCTFEHDAAGRLVRRVDPAGNEVLFTLNAAGLPLHVEYRDFNQSSGALETAQWEADYNAHGLVVAVRNRRHQGTGFNTEQTFEWDGWGRLVRACDAAEGAVEHRYDLRSRHTLRGELPGGGQYFSSSGDEWDRDDRRVCTSESEPQSGTTRETRFTYDSRGRLTGVQRPDETVIGLEWDSDSNLASWLDETGTTVTQLHDGRGLLLQRDIALAGGTAGSTRETWQYDGAGRLTSADSLHDGQFSAHTSWTWNTLHRPEASTLALVQGEVGLGSWTVGTTYNVHGDAVSLDFSDNGSLSFTRDTLSRVAGIIDVSTGATLAECKWAGEARPVLHTLGNGSQTSFSYDLGFEGSPRRVAHTRGVQVLWGIERRRDVRGLPVRERREHEGGSGRTWLHDQAQRLTRICMGAELGGAALDAAGEPVAFGMSRELQLDAFGSRIGESAVRDTAQDGQVMRLQAYAQAAGGCSRYASADGLEFAHDAAGRVTQDAAAELWFTHDYRGRTVAFDGTQSVAVPLRRLRHDALGRRVLEDEYEGGVLVSRTVLLYGAGDDATPIEEILLDASGVEVGRVQYARSSRNILAERVDGTWRYRHHDQDGSLIGLTDQAGARIAEFDYLPFGAPVRRGILYDAPEGSELTAQADTPEPGVTRIQVTPAGMNAGALAGRELAISLPAAFLAGAVLDNTAGTLDVSDPQGLIADAVQSLGARFVVFEARLSAGESAWSYDPTTDTSTLSVPGAGFSPWLRGGWLTPDVSRPAHLEISEVDPQGEWLTVRGRATSAAGARYRALPPLGVSEAGYDMDPGARYLFRGWRYDRATREGGSCRFGSYEADGRRYDPRVGRWCVPREGYSFAPWGRLADITPPGGAPGCCGTWSPNPACPAATPGPRASRCAVPTPPGWSG